MFGALGFGTMHKELRWPDDLVARLQLVAILLANTLARKRSEEEVRRLTDCYRGPHYRDHSRVEDRPGSSGSVSRLARRQIGSFHVFGQNILVSVWILRLVQHRLEFGPDQILG